MVDSKLLDAPLNFLKKFWKLGQGLSPFRVYNAFGERKRRMLMGNPQRRRAYIIQYLIEQGSASIRILAEICQVSERTIKRDIVILSGDYAITAEPGRNGRHYLIQNPKVDEDKLSNEQLLALYEAMEVVSEKTAKVIQSVIDKFQMCYQ